MAGPKALIIGRVAVKVLPDTSEFKKRLETQLKAINMPIVDIEVNPDFAGFLAELRKEVKEAEKRAPTLNIKVDLEDVDSVLGGIKQIDSALDDLNKSAASINLLDPDEIYEYRELLEQQLRDAKVNVEVDYDDLDSVRQAIDKLKGNLKDFESDPVRLSVDYDPDAIQANIDDLQRRIDDADRKAKIDLKINALGLSSVNSLVKGLGSATGIGFVRDQFRSFTNVLLNLGTVAPQVALNALKLTAITGTVIGVAGALASLSSSLAQIGPAALTLPGIFAGVAFGLGITAAALADFNKRLPEVGKAFNELQNLISNNFFAEFEKPFMAFFDAVFPRFRSEIGQTASVLGTFFGALSTSFKNALTPSIITELFANLRESIKVFTGATDAIANIFVTLGRLGAQYLPQLAGFVKNLANEFSTFLTEGFNSGELQAKIDTAIAALMDLGRAISATFGILGSIGKTAMQATGLDLEAFANSLERARDKVNSAEFKNPLANLLGANKIGIDNFFDTADLGTLAKAFSDVFSQIAPTVGKSLGSIVDIIGNVFSDPALQTGIVNLFESINTAINSARPGLEQAGQVLGPLATLIGTVLENIGKLVGAGGSAGAAFGPLLDTFNSIAESFGGFLDRALPLVQPLLGSFASGLNKIFTAAQPAIAEIQNLALRILPVLVPVAKFLSETVFTAMAAAVDGVAQAFRGINQIISGVIAIFKGDFSGIVDVVKGVFNLVVGVIKTVFTVTIVGGIRAGIAKIFGVVLKGLGKLPGLFSTIMKAGTKVFSVAWNLIKTLFTQGPKAAFNLVKAGFNLVVNFFKSFASNAGQIIKGLWSKVSGFFTAGASAVKGLVSALWNKVSGLFSAGVGAAKGLVSGLVSRVTGLITGMRSKVSGQVQVLWAKVRNFFAQGVRAAVDKIKEMATRVVEGVLRIKDRVVGLASRFLRAAAEVGRSIVEGIANGIRNGLGVIGDAINGLFDATKKKIKSVFGINSPAKTMIPIGEGIDEGVAKGIDEGQGHIDRALGRMKKKTKDTTEEVVEEVFDVVAALAKIKEARFFDNAASLPIVENIRKDIDELFRTMRKVSEFGGLEKGFTSSLQSMERAAKGGELPNFFERLSGLVDDFSDELKKTVNGELALKKLTRGALPLLEGLGNQFERVTAAIDEQSAALEGLMDEARDFASGIKDSIRGFGSIVANIPTSFDQVRDGLKASILDVRRFRSAILELQDKKLNGDLLKQILEAGPGEGLTAALAVLEGGDQGIKELNALQEELNSLAVDVGDTTARYLYDAQIDAARGILDGLIAVRSGIVETMRSAFQEALDLLEFTLDPQSGGGSGGGSSTGGGSGPGNPTVVNPPKGPDVSKIIGKTADALQDAIKDGIKGKDRAFLEEQLKQFTDLNADKIKKVLDGDASSKLIERAATVLTTIADELTKKPATGSIATGSTSVSQVAAAVTGNTTSRTTATTVIYNAAPNKSMSSEDDLFKALGKAGL